MCIGSKTWQPGFEKGWELLSTHTTPAPLVLGSAKEPESSEGSASVYSWRIFGLNPLRIRRMHRRRSKSLSQPKQPIREILGALL